MIVIGPPELILSGGVQDGDTIDTLVGSPIAIPTATATNYFNVALTVTDNTSIVDFTITNIYNLTYQATDSYGLTTTKTVNIVVTTLPTITIAGNTDGDTIATLAGQPFTFPMATGMGGLGETLTVTDDRNNVNLQTVGDYTLTYSTMDAYGYSTNASLTIRVKNAPSITIAGHSSGDTVATIVGATFSIPVATAVDGDGFAITVNEDSATVVDLTTQGIYVVTYSATDADGLTVTATLNVAVTLLPAITINGYADGDSIVVAVNQSIAIPTATAVDGDGNFILVTNTGASVNFNTTGTYTITYVAWDQYNISNTATLTINVHNPPNIIITGYSDGDTIATIVGAPITTPEATATDHGGASISVTTNDTSVDFNTQGDYNIVYTATDSNTLINTATLNIVVTTLPVITLSGGATNGSTIAIVRGTPSPNAISLIPSATAVDGEGTAITVTDNINSIDFNITSSNVTTYTATDRYGFVSTATINVVVRDVPAITIAGYADGDTLNTLQSNAITIPTATAMDGLGNALTVTDNRTSVDFDTIGTYPITYTTTDDIGLTSSASISIVVTDYPTISGVTDGDILVTGLNTAITIPTPTATSGLGNALTVTDNRGTVDFTTLGSYTVTYTATDPYGYSSSVSITIVVDNYPTIVILGYNDGDSFAIPLNTIVSVPSAVATNSSGDPTVVVTNGDTYDYSTEGTNIITYTATNVNGLSHSVSVSLIVRALPTIVLDGGAITNGTILYTGITNPIPFPIATATDASGNNLSTTNDSYLVDFNATNIYTVTYTAVDSFDLTNTATVDINIRNFPIIILSGGATNGQVFTYGVSNAYTIPTAIGTNSEGNRVTVPRTFDPNLSANFIRDYTVNYVAQDLRSLVSRASVTIRFVRHPIITLTGVGTNRLLVTTLSNAIALPIATAVDSDTNAVIVTDDSTNVDFNTIGMYTITYNATDIYGITSTETVNIVVTISPVITLNGATDGQTIVAATGSLSNIASATAIDGNSNALPVITNASDLAALDFNTESNYTIRYFAVDQYGISNTATVTYRILDPPTITLSDGSQNGDNIPVQIGSNYTVPTATAVDRAGNILTVIRMPNPITDYSMRTNYNISYTATDSSNIQTVLNILVAVSTPPVITINGYTNGETMNAVISNTSSVPTATAVDGDGMTIAVTNNGSAVDFNTLGTNIVTYGATDQYGFHSTATLVVVVTERPPLISIADGYSDGDTVTLTIGSVFIAPTASAIDYRGNSLNFIVDESTVDYNTAGSYNITYTATDTVNNLTTVDRITLVISQPILSGRTATLTYNNPTTDVSLEAQTGNIDQADCLIAGSFNLSSTSGNQTIFETGGIARGLSIIVESDDLVVSIGQENDDDIIISDLSTSTTYSFIFEIDIGNGAINLWLEQLDSPTDILNAHASRGTSAYTDSDWSDNDGLGIGTINGSAQGNYTNVQNTFSGALGAITIYSGETVD